MKFLDWMKISLSLPVRIVKFANSLDDKLMIFFSFSQKIDSDIFHANCILRRQFGCNDSFFSGENTKIFQNVVCWMLPSMLSVHFQGEWYICDQWYENTHENHIPWSCKLDTGWDIQDQLWSGRHVLSTGYTNMQVESLQTTSDFLLIYFIHFFSFFFFFFFCKFSTAHNDFFFFFFFFFCFKFK